jgi:putative (di)nucleoside polyphosphate hydrolase
MARPEDLPYRPCVGMMVFNRAGLVFIGRRLGGPEHTDELHGWQMPQGGLDEGEDPYQAALRELYEETSIRSVRLLAESRRWHIYDLPPELVGQAWKGKYRGQMQRWFAFRFVGEDSEIDIAHPGGGTHDPEFVEWRWEAKECLPDLVVPFKRKVYEAVVREFSQLPLSTEAR